MEQGRIHQCQCPKCQATAPAGLTRALHERMNILVSTLDERQRRLYAGLEAKKLGHGGDRLVSLVTGLSVKTIARGRRELDEPVLTSRIRKPGGGPRPVEKKDPAIVAALKQLVDEHTAGDPCSTRKWKRQSLRNLAKKLRPQHSVSAPTVARLLCDLDYSPKVNRKHLGASSPDRNRQFQYILRQKRLFLQHGWPVISVDAKKRELIGWFKNAGTAWCNEPFSVNTYDYPSLAEGVGIPYGLYDPARSEGFVSVGVSSNTADFAVASLLWWWRTYGRRRYADASRLLILADGGGSNGCRVRLWKYALQTQFVDRTGLEVSVCHYPTGASKWNPVEHSLFGQISKNWSGYPLHSYDGMLALIRGTETDTGLKVFARLDPRTYETRKKVSNEQMLAVNHHPRRVFPKWNYQLKPRPPQ